MWQYGYSRCRPFDSWWLVDVHNCDAGDCLFRSGDRLEPVCLLVIMSYKFCLLRIWGPPEARGPRARAPLAPLLIRHWVSFIEGLLYAVRTASRKNKTLLQNWNMTQPSQRPLLSLMPLSLTGRSVGPNQHPKKRQITLRLLLNCHLLCRKFPFASQWCEYCRWGISARETRM